MATTKPLSQRIVITGLGVVSCCGIGRHDFWNAVRDGVSGISHLDLFDVSSLPCRIGGQIRNFNPLDHIEAREARHQGRFVHYAIAAAREAYEDSGLGNGGFDPYDVGVAFGSSGAGYGNVGDEVNRQFVLDGLRAVDPYAIVEVPAHAATGHIAIDLGLKGPNLSASTGCATSVITMSQGIGAITAGAARAMVVGASEASLGPLIFGLLTRLRVMSTHNDDPAGACRPYDATRDGLVLSDGAGAVVIEAADHAMDRGAHIYAEVLGYGITSEAYHMVIALPTGDELAHAIRMAMRMARISPTDIDYVCAHGIGSDQYDCADTEGLKKALGNHAYRIAVSSIKPVTGQPFSAAGAMQTVATCMAFATDTLPPTINHKSPDPRCDLDYVPNRARRARVDTAIFNTHSFGGTHAAMILRRFDPSSA
jgi:3-oxoacyl-[acyl-carrier-protein] synthase II